MSNYTENTSGGQVNVLLATLFPKTNFIGNDFSYPTNRIVSVRVDESIGFDVLLAALETARVNPAFVSIGTDSWGHLAISVCNWDGTDIEIED